MKLCCSDLLSPRKACAAAIALPYAGRAQIPLNEFSHIPAWHDRLCELEAWREPFPATVTAA